MLEQDSVKAAETKIERKGSAADLIMLARLDAILECKLAMTDTDRRYYAHAIRMMERFRAMGLADDYVPKSNPSLWNNVHSATLEDFKLGDDEALRYTAEAIDAAKKQNWKHLNVSAESRVRLQNSSRLSGKKISGICYQCWQSVWHFPPSIHCSGVIDLKSLHVVNCVKHTRNYFMRAYWLRAQRLSPFRAQIGNSRNS
jgi:hypothetical protein